MDRKTISNLKKGILPQLNTILKNIQDNLNDLPNIYIVANGKTDGQTLTGGTNSGDDLTLESTSNDTNGYIILLDPTKLLNVKTGATQVAAGAIAGEIWATSGHATLPDNILLLGV